MLRARFVIAFLLLALASPACRESSTGVTGEERPRVLLLAVDGLEWDVVLDLAKAGDMPNLVGLMKRGSFGLLETFQPTLSPSIWTTVATGKAREKHGILGFQHRDPKDPSRKRLYTSADRRTKAFWDILSDAGRRVNVIGWFVTFPVESLNGVMVSQMNTASRLDEVRKAGEIAKGRLVSGVRGQVFPEAREAELVTIARAQEERLPEIERDIFGPLPDQLPELEQGFLKASRWAVRADAAYAEIARKLVAEGSFDVLAVYMGGPDVVGHRFWRYLYPRAYAVPPSDELVRQLGHVVAAYYRYVDRVLGSLLASSSSELTVFVVSDHGMEVANRDGAFTAGERARTLMSGDHKRPPAGVFVAGGPGIRTMRSTRPIAELRKADLSRIGSVFDVTPTLLALAGVPIGADMDGTVLTSVIDAPHLDRHPVRRVATHDTPEWLASRKPPEIEDPNLEERLEQLRSLGYIE